MSFYDKKIKQGAAAYLDPGEELLASIVAQPKGYTQATAGAAGPGSVVTNRGRNTAGRNREAARSAGFELGSPMALAVTTKRVLSLELGMVFGFGLGGKVKRLLGAAHVDDVEIERKPLKKLALSVNGVPFELETTATNDTKSLVAALERAKSGA